MELTAKWRKKHRGGGEDGIEDDSHPIDSQDQEEMVRSFEREHARQSRLWRRVFAGFLLGYTAFMVYSIFQQAWYPWELRFHAYFVEEMQSWMTISADWVAVLACSFAVRGLASSSKSSQQWLWYSCYVGLLHAVFWLIYMFRLPKFRWDVLWLPLGPLSLFSGAGICLYVDHLLHESLEDVKQLRSHMYNFKAL
ncbi:unnamed protein product [Musa acuminata subsp. malaccensis]|uniref:(wild Malaysian banana) hypothetical protein n=1 Tax=Musa acuminata subsp. malaccensis TaxID=214687 RepID=A0A804HXF8_MUSAM|nr:unnamed protein product [Musa acuminata subsp. malaccensis]